MTVIVTRAHAIVLKTYDRELRYLKVVIHWTNTQKTIGSQG